MASESPVTFTLECAEGHKITGVAMEGPPMKQGHRWLATTLDIKAAGVGHTPGAAIDGLLEIWRGEIDG